MVMVGLYRDAARTNLLLDATPYLTSIAPAWGARGCADCRMRGPIRYRDQLALMDAGLVHVGVYDQGYLIWAGRLEKPALVSNAEPELTAFGYSRCFDDLPYTALWSHSGTADWRPVQTTEFGNRWPNRYSFDTNNRLYIELVKNTTYNVAEIGSLAYRAPNSGSRFLTTITGNYVTTLPGANWAVTVDAITAAPGDAAWTYGGGGTIVAGSGSGSFSMTLAASAVAVCVNVYMYTGSSYYNTAENGTYYARLTNVRVTSQAAPIDLGNIAAHMVTTINGNGGLSASTLGCALTGLDLREAVYEDAAMSAMLDALCVLGDSAGNVWDWQVDTDRVLRLRGRDTDRRAYTIDAATLNLAYDYNNIANQRYATYQESNDFVLRTAAANDLSAQAQVGFVRAAAIGAQTTSSTTADTIRDTALADSATPDAAARFDVTDLYTETGVRVPLWLVRAGDVITTRNIVPGVASALDRARRFAVGRASVQYERGQRPVLRLEPRTPLPALDVLLART